jgi:hypothetical protein
MTKFFHKQFTDLIPIDRNILTSIKAHFENSKPELLSYARRQHRAFVVPRGKKWPRLAHAVTTASIARFAASRTACRKSTSTRSQSAGIAWRRWDAPRTFSRLVPAPNSGARI